MVELKKYYKLIFEIFLIVLLFSFLVGFYFLIVSCKDEKITIIDKKNKSNESLGKILTHYESTKSMFFASINGKLYYRADCQTTNRINSENIIWFINEQEAINSGYQYRPTKNCPILY